MAERHHGNGLAIMIAGLKPKAGETHGEEEGDPISRESLHKDDDDEADEIAGEELHAAIKKGDAKEIGRALRHAHEIFSSAEDEKTVADEEGHEPRSEPGDRRGDRHRGESAFR